MTLRFKGDSLIYHNIDGKYLGLMTSHELDIVEINMKENIHNTNNHEMVYYKSGYIKTFAKYKCVKCGVVVGGNSPDEYAKELKKTKKCK